MWTKFILNTTSFILWQIYAYLEGSRDGNYYHEATKDPSWGRTDLHPLFTIMRAILGLMCLNSGLDFVRQFNTGLVLFMCAAFIGTFSYWHNGNYYVTRHRLDPKQYPLGWKSTSTTSRATYDLSYITR